MLGKAKYILNEIRNYSNLIEGHRSAVILDMLWCGLCYKASPSNYYHFDFRHTTHSERKSFVTHGISCKLMKKYNSDAAPDILYNKLSFAAQFQQYYGRACFNSKTVSVDDLNPYVGQRVIYKPLRGGQGRGIHVFHLDHLSLPDMVQQIHKLPDGVVESWVSQHPAMERFSPSSVNPIRLQTIYSQGNVHCICATLTVGCNGTEFANASAKSLFALIDVNTGIVTTDGCDYDNHLYIKHPESNIFFKGFQIPNWDAVLRVASKAAAIIPHIGYVGWDIAVTPDGAVLIEGNNDPGYTAYQLPLLTNTHHGTMALFKPFL